MDEPAAPFVRLDGSALAMALTLGVHTRIYVDEGDPPVLVIDAGAWFVTLDAWGCGARTVAVLTDLAVAAERMRAAVADREGPGALSDREPPLRPWSPRR